MKRCRFTRQAEQDLADLAAFIAEDDPTAAVGVLNQIETKCALLSQYPEAGRSREDLFPRLRSYPAGSYTIFYRILEDEVQILRVLHGSRDVDHVFLP